MNRDYPRIPEELRKNTKITAPMREEIIYRRFHLNIPVRNLAYEYSVDITTIRCIINPDYKARKRAYNREYYKAHPIPREVQREREYKFKKRKRIIIPEFHEWEKESASEWHMKNPQYDKDYKSANKDICRQQLIEWKLANPDKVKQYYKNWCKKYPGKLKEIRKKWADKNRDKLRKSASKFYYKNKESISLKRKENYLKKKNNRKLLNDAPKSKT